MGKTRQVVIVKNTTTTKTTRRRVPKNQTSYKCPTCGTVIKK